MPAIIRPAVRRFIVSLLISLILMPVSSRAIESQDTQLFISGFNAFQAKDYKTAAEKMTKLLGSYPDTQLRDMAIFWLARSSFKVGDKDTAAKYMSQFFREYPDNPLKSTVEEELAALAAGYAKTEKSQAETLTRKKREESVAREAAAAEERRAAEKKASDEKGVAEKREAERIATEKLAREKAEQEKAALERAEAMRKAREVAERERQLLAEEKAEAERTAAANAEQSRIAAEKAASEKAAAERSAREQAAADLAAKEAAVREEKRIAAEKLAAERVAQEAAEKKRIAEKKAEVERLAKEREAAARKRPAAEKSSAVQKRSSEAVKGSEASPATGRGARQGESERDRTVAGYREIIDSSPGSSAADAASAKLKAMGIDYPASAGKNPPAAATAQVLNLEVAQFVDVEFNVDTTGQVFPAGRRITIPYEVVNRGNGEDSYYLESGFPAEYNVQFFAEGNRETPVNLTPALSPGQRIKGVMAIAVPKGVTDGQKISHPVKLASRHARDVSQSRQITLIASAPLLKAVISTDRKEISPGEKVTYRVTLLNIGSASASGITLRMNFPPLYEPVEFIKSGFKQEMKAALLLDGLKLESGESRELGITFQLKDDAIARQELFLRGDLINTDLETSDTFVSAISQVQGISGVTARATSDRLIVIPGQTVSIPLIVTNTGNQREDFPIRPNIPPSITYALYQDLNRDGIRQPTDPVINHIGPLSPREEAYVILEVKTPSSENDGASIPLSVAFEPESDRRKSAAVNIKLAYSRPVVELAMTGRGGRLKPGEVATFDLTCTNRGSSIAKVVEMRSILPDALELVASDPAVTRGKGGEYFWKFEELGAGEKKGARVSIRVKPGVAVGTSLQVKNLLSYQDQLGNAY